jgi:GAF domain-containing protein
LTASSRFAARRRQICRKGGVSWGGRCASARPQIVNDVATDERMVYRTETLEAGFRSFAVLPLLVNGEAVGVLSLLSAEVGFFDDDEIKLLRELGGDIAFALESIAKNQQLDYLAYYDPLTGLANRALFEERLGQSLQARAAAKASSRSCWRTWSG